MSKDAKTYTAEEVTKAILGRVHEMLKKSNTSHEVETGEEPYNDDAECPALLADADIENSGDSQPDRKKKSNKPSFGDDSSDDEEMPDEEMEDEILNDAMENEDDEMDSDSIEADEEMDSEDEMPEADENGEFDEEMDEDVAEDDAEGKPAKKVVKEAAKPKKEDVEKAEKFASEVLGDKLKKMTDIQKTEIIKAVIAKMELKKGDLLDIKSKKVISTNSDRRVPNSDKRRDKTVEDVDYVEDDELGTIPAGSRVSDRRRSASNRRDVDVKRSSMKLAKFMKNRKQKGKKLEKFLGVQEKKPRVDSAQAQKPMEMTKPTGNLGY